MSGPRERFWVRPKLEQRRQALRGLGESARTLREARAALALWIYDIERADGAMPL